MELVKAEPVSSIEQIQKETPPSRWIFRGQSKSKWGLETSLERACISFGLKISRSGLDLEGILLREFERRIHHYQSYVPKDPIELLAYMQHFGAPTRFLDWTYSVHIAVYFAIEAMTDDPCAVWAIHQKWLQREGMKLFKSSPNYPKDSDTEEKFRRYITGIHQKGDAEPIWKVIRESSAPTLIFNANPYRLHERLTIQKGLFLSLGNANATFQDSLRALPEFKKHVRKFKIESSRRLNLLRKLDLLNVNAATLFPGLDGFARSLRVFHHRID